MKYVGDEGMLYCKLKMALYGCIQASKLWYIKLSEFLKWSGYGKFEVKPCVFQRVLKNRVLLFIVYVNGIVIFAPEEEIKLLHGMSVDEFRWVTIGKEKVYYHT
jgi:hypothetical protein